MSNITIVCPVYNSAKYLVETIDSVLRQDFNDWELVLVDDMSTDNSVEIIKSYSSKDKRIILLSTETNFGPAKARNVGIDYAILNKSEYLAFLDSDDQYEPTFLSRMYHEISSKEADVVWCNSFSISSSEKCQRNIIDHKFGNKLLGNREAISSIFEETNGIACLWNKMYRCSFIEKYNLRLNEERVRAEDWEFNLMLFNCSPIIWTIDIPLYNYITQNNSSVMRSFREKDFNLYKRSLSLLTDISKEWNLENLMTYQYDNFIYYSICYIIMAVLTNQKKTIAEVVVNDRLFREIIKTHGNSNLTTKHKFYLLLIKHKMIISLVFAIRLFG